jgi:hypothetical protein
MIDIVNSGQFRRLIEAMSRDIVDAQIHYKLYRDLHAALGKHMVVEAQSRTFWSLTLQAHLNACLHLLCRMYDQNLKALHLRSWLLTIRENLNLFDEKEFRERLKDNPYVESLARHPRKPDATILDKDLRSCSTKDPIVKTLQIHRGSQFVHKSAKNVVAERDIGDDHPLTYGDVEALLKRATEILNRYSNLFAANTYSTQIIGHDDFKFIIQCVEEKVEANRAERRRLSRKT